MPLKSKSKKTSLDFKEIIAGYATTKVIDWILKNKVDQGVPSNFKWSREDKELLKQVLLDPKHVPADFPLDDPKFKRFFQSVIDNGLNTDDVRLFHRYKNKLPLRALGLAYDLSDFNLGAKGLVSNKKLDAGFYMLEVIVSPKTYSSRLPIVLTETRQKDKELESFSLIAQAEKMTKRLIKLENDVSLKILVDSSWQPMDIKQFKLVKLTRNFFLSRINKKLGKDFSLSSIDTVSDVQLRRLWTQYDQIFIRQLNNDRINYHAAIVKQEKQTIPTATQQMKNLILSLLK